MTVAEFMAKEIRRRGVEYAFGIPGGEVATILDALHQEGIEFVLTSHEAGAAFMADAYYRRTGKIAVVLATLGPGATNAVSGAAQAYLDRSPILFVTGAVSTDLKDVYPHQILDHVEMFRPVTKWSQEISADNVGGALHEAFAAMQSFAPGPAHIDLPVDVALQIVTGGLTPNEVGSPGADDKSATLRQIVAQVDSSRRPVFIVGLEGADKKTRDILRTVVNTHKIPVLTTYKAKGVLEESHPLSLGAIGLSPSYDKIAVEYLRSADLVMALGVDPVELRSDWLAVWSSLQPIGVGQDCRRFPGFPFSVTWSGHPGDFLAGLNALATSPHRSTPDASLERLRAQHQERWHAADERTATLRAGILAPHHVLRVINEQCSGAIVTIDTGAMRIAANHLIHASQPNQILQSNGLGTMGYALPAAIGAQIAEPDARVVALTGDAGLLMLMGELSTGAARRLPIVVIVFVDQSLSLIDLKQSRMHYHHVGVDVFAPNFAGIAEQFGGVGFISGSVEEFRQQLEMALSTRDRLTIIHVPVDPAAYDALM